MHRPVGVGNSPPTPCPNRDFNRVAMVSESVSGAGFLRDNT